MSKRLLIAFGFTFMITARVVAGENQTQPTEDPSVRGINLSKLFKVYEVTAAGKEIALDLSLKKKGAIDIDSKLKIKIDHDYYHTLNAEKISLWYGERIKDGAQNFKYEDFNLNPEIEHYSEIMDLELAKDDQILQTKFYVGTKAEKEEASGRIVPDENFSIRLKNYQWASYFSDTYVITQSRFNSLGDPSFGLGAFVTYTPRNGALEAFLPHCFGNVVNLPMRDSKNHLGAGIGCATFYGIALLGEGWYLSDGTRYFFVGLSFGNMYRVIKDWRTDHRTLTNP